LLALAAKQDLNGRVAVAVEGGAPIVVPVDFSVAGHDLFIRVGDGTTAHMVTGRPVAFEVDTTDLRTGVAWSVLVRGLAIPAGSASTATGPVPRPHVPEPGEVLIRIRGDVVTGRRFTPNRPRATPPAPTAAAGAPAPASEGGS